jgi:hypothetical protein
MKNNRPLLNLYSVNYILLIYYLHYLNMDYKYNSLIL